MHSITEKVLAWYQDNKRSLPWRDTVHPYRSLVSEFMLQQTRVETVKPYFAAFLSSFPTIEDLAAAPIEDVLQHWKGLGYYSRAHNLHKAAQIIAQRESFPSTVAELRTLPGVGEYIAGAIASIAFGQDEPAVDGNHHRVFSRLFCDSRDRKFMWEHARELLPTGLAGDYNQALMDLANALCKPKEPLCTECPLSTDCLAFQNNSIRQFPPPKQKKEVPQKTVHSLWILNSQGQFLVAQRPDTGLYKGLFELPSFFMEEDATVSTFFLDEFGVSITLGASLGTVSHRLTHMLITNELFAATIEELPTTSNTYTSFRWIAKPDDAPLSSLAQKVCALPHQEHQLPLF